MNSFANMPVEQGNNSEIATVQGGFGKEYMVQASRGVFRARLAFSCLVTPEPNDKVIVNYAGDASYILAIVERPESDDMKLNFNGNVAMEAKAGDLSFVSNQNVNVVAAKEHAITSTALNVTSGDVNLHTENAIVQGKKITSQWQEVSSIVDAFNFVANRLTQHFKNSFKTVEGVEQKNSQNYLQNVGKTMSVRSHNSVITARKDMKIDGERIHMG